MQNVLLIENLTSIISRKKAMEDERKELYDRPQELAEITVESIISELELNFEEK
ncbi:hypothetical protein [Shouchella clausii]|uniref:hypothetical protein n=1 Tax=Shouchella clausii TaxID=79880 RepID=UPI001C732CBC|nr:hypothetical protein [Shouchella clausii]MBX0320307.1 hypothetical protein [Shouchella clausii]MEB5480928.1 hypothetical protein [Shouchella clausii]